MVVPAHNEAAVIDECLLTLLEGMPEDCDVELVVVCNGCTDGTADVARATAPSAIVLELEDASKSAALNAGDAMCKAFPRVYLDADIGLRWTAFSTLVASLADPELRCVSPAACFELDGRPWVVRRFYDAFARLPYATNEIGGKGAYAVDAEGHERLGLFPDLVADDEYVRSIFTESESNVVGDAVARVRTPYRVADLVRVRQRVYRGNTELAHYRAHDTTRSNSLRAVAALALSRPASAVVFIVVNLLARVRARGVAVNGSRWERDASTR